MYTVEAFFALSNLAERIYLQVSVGTVNKIKLSKFYKSGNRSRYSRKIILSECVRRVPLRIAEVQVSERC